MTDRSSQIIRYLEHYCKLSSWKAYEGSIADVDLNAMTFVCGAETYKVAFNPPMQSLRDTRERVIEMDKECLQGLGKSEITVGQFVPPTGIYLPLFLVILSTFLGFSQRWWFGKGQVVEQFLGPMFAKFCWQIQPFLIMGMIGIHAAELVYFVQYKLRKHSVNPRTLCFWQWVVFTFIEGQPAYMRFNELVAMKQEEKQKQKH